MQAEGLSVNDTDGCSWSQNTTVNSSCTQVMEAIPRGMVVATTDLQMRSLYEEDEQQVGFCNRLLCMFLFLYLKSSINGD